MIPNLMKPSQGVFLVTFTGIEIISLGATQIPRSRHSSNQYVKLPFCPCRPFLRAGAVRQDENITLCKRSVGIKTSNVSTAPPADCRDLPAYETLSCSTFTATVSSHQESQQACRKRLCVFKKNKKGTFSHDFSSRTWKYST